MGSLANLYISQSYTSLIHLGNDSTASATFNELQDGLGNGLGIFLNTQGDFSASGDLIVNTFSVDRRTDLHGAVSINTYISASTPAYLNSFQPYYSDVVRVTGSFNNDYPSVNDVAVGWVCNGINVATNSVVTAVSGNVGDIYITIAGQFPQPGQTYSFTGSTNIPTMITGSLLVSNDLIVSGTLFAREVITTIESSSVIFSSGSNILGDSILDTQTLIGSVIMSGSSSLTGSMGITGNITGLSNLTITGNISSSTISGIGNVTTYSQSVDSRLDYLEGDFSQSVDSRLDQLEVFTASADNKFSAIQSSTASLNAFTQSAISKFNEIQASTASLNQFTQSADSKFDAIQASTSSLNQFSASINNKFNTLQSTTSSLNSYTASADTKFNTIQSSTASLNQFTASANGRLNNLESTTASLNTSITNINAFTQSASSSIASLNSWSQSLSIQLNTGSFATTGSNTFIGNEIFSGSVRGLVNSLSISSLTASIDCSTTNFFTLNLVGSTNTRLSPTNIRPGQTISLLVTQDSPTAGTLSYPSTMKFSGGFPYTASAIPGAQDVLTFISYDSTNLYCAYIKNLV